MARMRTDRTGQMPPALWPAWLLERTPGGFFPSDPESEAARRVERHELRERRNRWRERHRPDLSAAEFSAAISTERNRRRSTDE